MLGYYAQDIIYCWQGQGQGQVKGQIHLIGYNFASNCHRDFKLGSYLPPPSTVLLVGIIVWGKVLLGGGLHSQSAFLVRNCN